MFLFVFFTRRGAHDLQADGQIKKLLIGLLQANRTPYVTIDRHGR
jgi:hypothetical protein